MDNHIVLIVTDNTPDSAAFVGLNYATISLLHCGDNCQDVVSSLPQILEKTRSAGGTTAVFSAHKQTYLYACSDNIDELICLREGNSKPKADYLIDCLASRLREKLVQLAVLDVSGATCSLSCCLKQIYAELSDADQLLVLVQNSITGNQLFLYNGNDSSPYLPITKPHLA